jgi:WhiB family transcriptional regulator, redox-sensing transcriptional regulator
MRSVQDLSPDRTSGERADRCDADEDRTPRLPRVPELVDVSEGWELDARCREEDAALFFGPNRFEPKRERVRREAAAKAICAACPALAACREHALVHEEPYGVWGGLGEADRRALLADRGGIATAV